MDRSNPSALHAVDEDAALRALVEGTATETGERFFVALVQGLARALNTCGAWVTEYDEKAQRLRALAFWLRGELIEGYEYDVAGTPCEPVIDRCDLYLCAENVVDLFPNDPDLAPAGAVSYMGTPLLDVDGRVLGHLAVIDDRPMPAQPRCQALFRIFAARAAAEHQRLRAEAAVREREEKLRRLVGSAMDAIIELDPHLKVTLMNPAAEKVFGVPAARVVGADFARFLAPADQKKLSGLIAELGGRPSGPQSLWIPGGLTARNGTGKEFPAEATLSRFEMGRQTFHTLILRNVNDRLEAEARIRALTREAEYLREEVEALHNFDEILGHSQPLLRAMDDVARVADTDVTVLILGETGTGKELFARAIHAASPRRDRPLIRVNCGAIPTNLIESELFGHERGAFTGATQRREGRFALADGGTIFLDEVGELPLDLQPKLLRVVQEGEFEPVGSSRTRRADVRILAATNRDLEQEVRDGTFRSDLYYRLNVFPITIPPLRERGDDIPLLAETFAQRFAQRLGRPCVPLDAERACRLQAYAWPGNVRELQNVVERGMVTSRDGRLDLDRALPETRGLPDCNASNASSEQPTRPRTEHELREMERDNMILALEQASWRVAGADGAARLLGVRPSTFSSRMKALGIERPR